VKEGAGQRRGRVEMTEDVGRAAEMRWVGSDTDRRSAHRPSLRARLKERSARAAKVREER
jgi:hypothetical protein